MSAVHPAPLSSLQGASPWRVLCFLFSKHTVFPGSAQRCPGPTGRGSRFTPVGRSRICSLPAQAEACARESGWPGKMGEGRKRCADAFPGFIPGSGGVLDAGSTRPRHGGRGKWRQVGKKETATQRKPRTSQHEARGFLHLPQQVGDASSRYRGKRFDRSLNCRSRWPCRTGCCRWSCGRSRSR